MTRAEFVSRLTNEQVFDLLVNKCGYRIVRLLNLEEVETECLLTEYQRTISKPDFKGKILFFVASYSEKYIHLLDNEAYVIGCDSYDEFKHYISKVYIPEMILENFLFSVFGDEYVEYVLACAEKRREELQRQCQEALVSLNEEVAMKIVRFSKLDS